MALGRPRNEKRDLEIREAALAGASPQSLAERYNLTVLRVQAILTAERHKAAVRPHAIYRTNRYSD